MRASSSYTSGLLRCPKHPHEKRTRLASGKASECAPCRRERDQRRADDPDRAKAKSLYGRWWLVHRDFERYLDQLGVPK